MTQKIIPGGPVIVFGGLHGVGKSTYAKHVANKFKLEYVSTGLIFRSIASEMKLSLLELSELASRDPSIDMKIEEMSKNRMLRGGVVFDSLIAPFLAREIESFKVYLFAPFEVRINRIAKRDSKEGAIAMKETLLREKLELKRFKKYYGFSLEDTSFYDMLLNTSILEIEDNVKIIEAAVEAYLRRRWSDWL